MKISIFCFLSLFLILILPLYSHGQRPHVRPVSTRRTHTIAYTAPRKINRLFLGEGQLWIAASDGLHRFANGKWHSFGRTQGLPDSRVNDVCVAGGRIIAGTSTGVALSPDGGITWRSFGMEEGIAAIAITTVAAEGETIIAGTGTGLSVSLDGGESWRLVTSYDGLTDDSIYGTAVIDGVIYVAAGKNINVSRNGGKRWESLLSLDFELNEIHRIFKRNGEIALHFRRWKEKEEDSLYLLKESDTGENAYEAVCDEGILFLADNYGVVEGELFGRNDEKNLLVTIQSTEGDAIEYQTNGWKRFQKLWNFTVDGDRWYAVDDHGLMISRDAGTTWRSSFKMEPQFDIPQLKAFYAASVAPQGEVVYVIKKDALLRSDDGGETWTNEPIPEDSGDLIRVHNDGNSLFLVGERGFFRRREGLWEKHDSPSDVREGFDRGLPLEIFSAKGKVIVYGIRGRYYVSDDGGETFRFIPVDNQSEKIFISAAISGESIALLSTSDTLHLSEEGGRSWTEKAVNQILADSGTAALESTSSIDVFSQDNGLYLLCRRRGSEMRRNFLLHSDDWGESWKETPLPIFDGLSGIIAGGSAGGVSGLYVYDNNFRGQLYRKVNKEWLPITGSFTDTVNATVESLVVGDEEHLYVSTPSLPVQRYSRTSGEWEKLPPLPYAPSFLKSDPGRLAVADNTLFLYRYDKESSALRLWRRDGGEWIVIPTPSSNQKGNGSLEEYLIPSGKNLFLMRRKQELYRSEDLGKTWQQLPWGFNEKYLHGLSPDYNGGLFLNSLAENASSETEASFLHHLPVGEEEWQSIDAKILEGYQVINSFVEDEAIYALLAKTGGEGSPRNIRGADKYIGVKETGSDWEPREVNLRSKSMVVISLLKVAGDTLFAVAIDDHKGYVIYNLISRDRGVTWDTVERVNGLPVLQSYAFNFREEVLFYLFKSSVGRDVSLCLGVSRDNGKKWDVFHALNTPGFPPTIGSGDRRSAISMALGEDKIYFTTDNEILEVPLK